MDPQPIETAPKDGTPILVGRAGHEWEKAWWEEESVWRCYWRTPWSGRKASGCAI